MNLNAKRDYLFRKQNCKKNLPIYIKEINSIVDAAKGTYQILKAETSDTILQKSASLIDETRSKKYKYAFNKKEHFLQKCLFKCHELLPEKVYLYLDYSKDCGVALIDSLLMIKTDFSFTSEHAGIIVLISDNLSNKVILDYYEENNEGLIEIELFGEKWGTVNI